MALSIVRLGEAPRRAGELRLGTVRRPPRGVRKEDFARRGWYDVWLPLLSPSAPLVKEAMAARTEAQWNQFKRKFRAEMAKPEPVSVLNLVAVLSRRCELSLGCYCKTEAHCHRSVLRELLLERKAKIAR
jgi:uncharacterized protein YeaO (DUF488 family)